jgi:hypothetical protein
MPADCREVFEEVLQQHLPGWRGAPPEPEVMWDQKPYTMRGICNLVDNPNFAAELPEPLIALICDQADGTYPPFLDHTYQGGAAYVRKIIERRRRDFESKRGGP